MEHYCRCLYILVLCCEINLCVLFRARSWCFLSNSGVRSVSVFTMATRSGRVFRSGECDGEDVGEANGDGEVGYQGLGGAPPEVPQLNIVEEAAEIPQPDFDEVRLRNHIDEVVAGLRNDMALLAEEFRRSLSREMTLKDFAQPASVEQQTVELLPSSGKGLKLKPCPYDGTEPWEPYCAQFERLARRQGWRDDEKVDVLAAALRGPAMELLAQQEKDCTFSELSRALGDCFGSSGQEQAHLAQLQARQQQRSESVRQFHQAIQSLISKAWPGMRGGPVEALAVFNFARGLRDPELRKMVLGAGPRDMGAALREALRCEALLHVAQAGAGQARQTVAQLQRATEGSGRSVNAVPRGLCWRCDQPGHWVRDCPSRPPRGQQTENERQPN